MFLMVARVLLSIKGPGYSSSSDDDEDQLILSANGIGEICFWTGTTGIIWLQKQQYKNTNQNKNYFKKKKKKSITGGGLYNLE